MRAPAPTSSRRRDMMDGRIGAIRDALEDAGHVHTRILAYSRQVRVGVLRPVPRCRRLAPAALGKGDK